MLFRTDAHKGDIFLSVETLNCSLSFYEELRDEGTVVDCLVLAHSALNSDSLLVDNHNSQNAHMGINPIQRFFYFL